MYKARDLMYFDGKTIREIMIGRNRQGVVSYYLINTNQGHTCYAVTRRDDKGKLQYSCRFDFTIEGKELAFSAYREQFQIIFKG